MTIAASSDLTVTLTPLTFLAWKEEEWRDLENRAGGYAFFLSRYWICAWLRSLPEDIRLSLMRIADAGQIIGLGILVEGYTPVLRLLRLPQVALHETGNPEIDTITIEYNGFLAADQKAQAVNQAAIEWLSGGGTPNKVIHFGGVDVEFYQALQKTGPRHGRSLRVLNESDASYVNLSSVRASGKDYLDSLSRNTRQNLRRELRRYEAKGPLRYHIAGSLEEALEYFTALGHLHQSYWTSRGKPGAFSKSFFVNFHTNLIRCAFADGHIEIAKVTVGDALVGYLYNFNWQGTVHAYQSGFCYDMGDAFKPGYVCHYLAIVNALERDLSVYDFMAGFGQHKSSLGNGKKRLFWVQSRPNNLLIRLEDFVRSLRKNSDQGQGG